MMAVERDYAFEQKTWLDRQRFRPQQWSTRPNWPVYSADTGEAWLGFERAHARQVEMFCAHDIHEFERLSGHSARVPADRMAGVPA
jgi:hypothetical protein